MNDRDHSIFEPRVLFPFILITMIWGSTWLVITGQLGVVPPAWSITYRFGIGAAVMFLYAALTAPTIRLDGEGHLLAAALGIPQFCLNFNCVYLAERHVTSGLVAVVFALLLVPNTFLSRIFLKHHFSPQFLLGSLIAVAGVALLFIQEIRTTQIGATEVAVGIGLTLLGVVSASIGNVIQAADRLRSRSIAVTVAWAMAYAAVANLLIAWIFYGPPVFDQRPSYVAGLFYLGVIASAVTFPLYFRIIQAIGPGRAAYSSLLIPIIAMTLSTVFEHYAWSALAIFGGILALAGLFIALRARRGEVAAR
jgi:drug/metabolite transporter (DMT)-like permease